MITAMVLMALQQDGLEFFEKRVRPVLAEHCYTCHSAKAKKIKAGLRLDSRALILHGGDTGPAVVPGNPAKSLMIIAVRQTTDDLSMPPKKKLSERQIADLEKWVQVGAPWPEGEAPARAVVAENEISEKDRSYWAYQPVTRPAVPAVRNRAWVRQPVDAFILSKLEAKGITPAPPVDRRALIRRATYDLTGLPPTPEEVEAFVKDRDPKAYEKLVDRLLESPHYGEKWGRHWLDLVRFAETNGYERDSDKPHAWRYRDYVIRAFNEDKPYDRFVLEQLAGDELPDPTADSIIATGYYRLGIWDDEPADPELAEYDMLDGILSTTSQVMLGMTMGCVRCHEHKKDPIPHPDYYRMLAFIRNISPMAKGGPNVERRIRTEAGAEARRAEEIREIEARVGKIEADLVAGLDRAGATDLTRLTYRMYRGGWEKLPVFKELKVEREGTLATGLIDIGIAGRNQRFAFVFSGSLNVPAAGEYTFYVNSDDGARLRIDGREVLLWDGIHGTGKPHTAKVRLKKGRVPLELEYFQNEGGLGLTVEWSGPSVPRRALSAGSGPGLERLVREQGKRILGPKRLADYRRLKRKLAVLKKSPKGDLALCVSETNRVRDTFVLRRGNPSLKGRKVEPGFPSVLGFDDPVFPAKPTGPTTGRRTALAKWIVDPKNPLAGRAMANRLWQYHFGRGIVPSSNDFGKLGSMPTHPGLLDWLVSEFIAGKWKIKRMHRLLMTSSAYRMSPKDDPAAIAKDPENKLFWRFNMRRLTAEEIRDSILAVNGSINLEMGGPSVYPPMPPAVLATASRPNQAWGRSPEDQWGRRSVYIKVKRSLLDPMLAGHDFADTDSSTAVRFSTTVPTQALTMLNSDFMADQAKRFAARLKREAPGGVRDQVERALRLALQRPAGAEEVARGVRLIGDLRTRDRLSADGALQTFCLLVLNLNEFVYLD